MMGDKLKEVKNIAEDKREYSTKEECLFHDLQRSFVKHFYDKLKVTFPTASDAVFNKFLKSFIVENKHGLSEYLEIINNHSTGRQRRGSNPTC